VEPLLPPALPEDLDWGRVVGITTTVPAEILFAAGCIPVDLNNLFITAQRPGDLARMAERAGFPRTCCCWTKGIYGAVKAFSVRRVLTVTRGDCSNAQALAEILQHEGVECLAFDYPARQDRSAAQRALTALAESLGTDLDSAEQWRQNLKTPRAAAREIDGLSWRAGRSSGLENHLWLVSTSDFCGEPARFERAAQAAADRIGARPPIAHALRLGVCGVPPIVPDLFGFLESLGALVVYNELPRQFCMDTSAPSLAEQYTRYTYPYGVFARLRDIRAQCRPRRLDGLIHYVQSFCHRRIEDRIIRDRAAVPVLTLEADRPGPLSGQLKTRLETFAQVLLARRRRATAR
jgi:benzoyl-CoA reductase/2-hydroxyglutaryl-CoA dehydratase subunit BcrC/BadD/HgdB